MSAELKNGFLLVYFCIFLIIFQKSLAQVNKENDNQPNRTTKFSPNLLKQVMWRHCSNNSYLTCAKLALVQVIEKLDSSEKYQLLPGISLDHAADEKIVDNNKNNNSLSKGNENSVGASVGAGAAELGNDFNEALDRYLMMKIKRYIGSLTLSVKLLDKNTLDEARSVGDMIFGSSVEEARGRGKKKYMQTLMIAGWMSGATLLALTLKTIAVLSGKALLAALLSLMISAISAFSGSKGHHPETKSTTYEIITKPIVAHSHSSDIHEAHASEHHPFAYRRSIDPELVLGSLKAPRELTYDEQVMEDAIPIIPSDVDRVIYRIHHLHHNDKNSPYYYQTPEYTPPGN